MSFRRLRTTPARKPRTECCCQPVAFIIAPDTVIRWHRGGLRSYWRWKSRRCGGRPEMPADIRQLIREISAANPLWGAARIHGELLKLGIDIGQTTVAKYMARGRRPPSQGWKTFLRNHADGIASMDLFVVPTISFRLLYGLLILHHSRRELLKLGVTAHPNAEWIARQLTEAYGWRQTPSYLIRDRDCVYGAIVIRRLRAMGIGIIQSRPGRLGKMGVPRGLSARSDGNVLTMSSCLASGIFAICLPHIKDTTTRPAPTSPYARTRHSRATSRPTVAFSPFRFWPDYTTNMFELEFPTRTTRISASSAVRDRNSPIKAHQIKLQRSLIDRTIDRFEGVSQLPWVCGRDRFASRHAIDWAALRRLRRVSCSGSVRATATVEGTLPHLRQPRDLTIKATLAAT